MQKKLSAGQGITENTAEKLVCRPMKAYAASAMPVLSLLIGLFGCLGLFMLFAVVRVRAVWNGQLIAACVYIAALEGLLVFLLCRLLSVKDAEVIFNTEGIRLSNKRRGTDEFISWQDVKAIYRTEREWRPQQNQWKIPGIGKRGLVFLDMWVDAKAIAERFPKNIPIIRR